MSNRPGGSGFPDDDVVRGAGVQLAKGAGLVLVAIIIGVVLLQVVDDGKSGPIAAAPTTTTTTAKTTSSPPNATTTTKKPTTPAKPPEQVRVVVLNAGAKTGAAKAMSTALRSKGYTNQPNQATDWTNKNQTGNTVLCKPGFEREASSLAVAVGNAAKTVALPTPPPPSSNNVDCVVAVGA